MNSNEDFGDFSVTKWQEINRLSRRMRAINSLLNFFERNETKVQSLKYDCEVIANCLKAEFEHDLETLVKLVESPIE